MLQGHREVNQSAHRVITMTENFPEAPPPLTLVTWTGMHETKAGLRRGVGAHLQSATCSKQNKQKKPKHTEQKPAEGHDCLQASRLTVAYEKERCSRDTSYNPLEQFIIGVTLSVELGFMYDMVGNLDFSKAQNIVNDK